MVKITNFVISGNTISFVILVEDNENLAFKMTLDNTKENLPIIESDVPERYKMYERQARTALKEHRNQPLPPQIVSAWF